VVVSQLALHHLPDFWKAVALQRIYNVLMPSGKLFLRDTVYSFKTSDYESFFSNWVLDVNEKAGPETSRDLLLAICEEYTTLSWVMEGLLARVGFQIEKSEYRNGFLALYLCKKV
jgi:SAM-dependent methyltransferase